MVGSFAITVFSSTKKRKLVLLLVVAFILGLLATYAEPDLSVLAGQVKDVMKPIVLKVGIAVGVGIFLVIGIMRIVFKKQLSFIILLFYMLAFAIALLVVIQGNAPLLPLSFDSGGVTTGPITVPFLMALGVGIANVLSGKNAKEDSFGIVALCSIGPILVVLILSMFLRNSTLVYDVSEFEASGLSDNNILKPFLHAFAGKNGSLLKVAISLLPVLAFFIVYECR